MGFFGNMIGALVGDPEGWVKRAIVTIQAAEQVARTIVSDSNVNGRVNLPGNFVGLDLLGTGNVVPEAIHPDLVRVAIRFCDSPIGDPVETDDDPDEVILRPGQVIAAPYESFTFRRLDVGGLLPIAGPTTALVPRARLWSGWSIMPPTLPAPTFYQLPVRPLSVSGSSGAVTGTVGTSSAQVAAQACGYAFITNTHATNVLTYTVGGAAVVGDHPALAAGDSSPLIPVANTDEFRVIGSAAGTTFCVTWILEV